MKKSFSKGFIRIRSWVATHWFVAEKTICINHPKMLLFLLRLFEEMTETTAMARNATERTAEATIPRMKNLSFVDLVGSSFETPASSNMSSKNFLNSNDTAKPAPIPVARSQLITCNFNHYTWNSQDIHILHNFIRSFIYISPSLIFWYNLYFTVLL